MQISVGSDHRGVQVKRQIIDLLEQLGHKTLDVGTQSEESVDYPDIAAEVARRVSEGEAERGILIYEGSVYIFTNAERIGVLSTGSV